MVECYVTVPIRFLDIQWGKEGMKSILYNLELDATAACTKILIEETKGIGLRALKGSMEDCFLFNS